MHWEREILALIVAIYSQLSCLFCWRDFVTMKLKFEQRLLIQLKRIIERPAGDVAITPQLTLGLSHPIPSQAQDLQSSPAPPSLFVIVLVFLFCQPIGVFYFSISIHRSFSAVASLYCTQSDVNKMLTFSSSDNSLPGLIIFWNE